MSAVSLNFLNGNKLWAPSQIRFVSAFIHCPQKRTVIGHRAYHPSFAPQIKKNKNQIAPYDNVTQPNSPCQNKWILASLFLWSFPSSLSVYKNAQPKYNTGKI